MWTCGWKPGPFGTYTVYAIGGGASRGFGFTTRELHWHKTAEVLLTLCYGNGSPLTSHPFYVVGICSQGKSPSRYASRIRTLTDSAQGSTQISSVDENGRNYLATVVCPFAVDYSSISTLTLYACLRRDRVIFGISRLGFLTPSKPLQSRTRAASSSLSLTTAPLG